MCSWWAPAKRALDEYHHPRPNLRCGSEKLGMVSLQMRTVTKKKTLNAAATNRHGWLESLICKIWPIRNPSQIWHYTVIVIIIVWMCVKPTNVSWWFLWEWEVPKGGVGVVCPVWHWRYACWRQTAWLTVWAEIAKHTGTITCSWIMEEWQGFLTASSKAFCSIKAIRDLFALMWSYRAYFHDWYCLLPQAIHGEWIWSRPWDPGLV